MLAHVAASLMLVQSVTPILGAHAHNDYAHPRPLQDALSQGFTSVEADVFLVDGKLLVAHSLPETDSDRTLERLYLMPLAERAKQNKGWIYDRETPFVLLVDIKDRGPDVYEALKPLLQKYANLLTRFENGNVVPGAVTVLISGSRPVDQIVKERSRWVALDGRLPDRESGTAITPWISEAWGSHFTWRGIGEMPEAELRKLKELVEQVHRRGAKIRFWGAPDTPNAWRTLLGAGVDIINTDRLAAFREFSLKSR